jgi:hypothetical protein
VVTLEPFDKRGACGGSHDSCLFSIKYGTECFESPKEEVYILVVERTASTSSTYAKPKLKPVEPCPSSPTSPAALCWTALVSSSGCIFESMSCSTSRKYW